MYTDLIFVGIIGALFLFTSDFGKSIISKVKGLIPSKSNKAQNNSDSGESVLLKRADLWEQLNQSLPDDPMAQKLMNDLWPKLIQKAKE